MKNFLRFIVFWFSNTSKSLRGTLSASCPFYMPGFCELTLKDLETMQKASNSFDVWAVNNTVFSSQPGDLIISLTYADPDFKAGRYPSLFLQQTWLPQCITNQMHVDYLVRDPEFRRALSKGLLTIFPSTIAGTILKLPTAAAEKQRLIDRREAVRAACAANR